MRPWTFLFVIGFAVTSSTLASTKGLKVVYDLDISAGQKSMRGEARVFFQDGNVRVETVLPGSLMGETIILHKKEDDKSYILFPTKKTYMETSKEHQVKMAHKKENKPTPFVDTNQKKTIAGYKCNVKQRTTRLREEYVCVSTSLSKEFGDLAKQMTTGKKKSFFPSELEGFPLEYKTSSNNKNGDTSLLRVRELTRNRLNSGMFQIPKNYKKQETTMSYPGAGKSKADAKKMDRQMEELKKMAEELKKQYGQK